MIYNKGFIALPILIFIAALAIGIVGYFGIVRKSATDQIACTMEAKLCSDGTAVGRTGPNCEFANCPSSTSTTLQQSDAAIKDSSILSGTSELTRQSNTTTNPPAALAVFTESYINTKYLFGFRYPDGKIPYIAVDKENRILLPAGANADRVVLAEEEEQIFSGIPKTLAFDVIKEDVSTENWLASNLQKYIPSAHFVSQKDIMLAGKKGVEVIGSGTGGSVYKLVLVKPGNYSIAINQSAPSEFLNAVLKTFAFDVQGLQ